MKILSMKIYWWRIVLSAVLVGIAAIALLVAIVAIFGPGEMVADQAFAERHGQWVGPLGGALFCFLGGYWVARSAKENEVIHGLLVGLATVAIDGFFLILMGVPFQLLFLASNVGRVVTGGLGGLAARHRRHPVE